MTVKIEGQLEVDPQRGVLYFHSNKSGATLLRIGKIVPGLLEGFDENTQIDVFFHENNVVTVTKL